MSYIYIEKVGLGIVFFYPTFDKKWPEGETRKKGGGEEVRILNLLLFSCVFCCCCSSHFSFLILAGCWDLRFVVAAVIAANFWQQARRQQPPSARAVSRGLAKTSCTPQIVRTIGDGSRCASRTHAFYCENQHQHLCQHQKQYQRRRKCSLLSYRFHRHR